MKRNVTVVCVACGLSMTGWVDDSEEHRPVHVGPWQCRCTKAKEDEE